MRKIPIYAFLLLGLSFLLLPLGCVESGPQRKAFVKEGKAYGVVRGAFRHRWWNYYERGLSFTEGAFYPQAVSDFKEAARQRGKDQRMARTYGMHFIDYFPHRELGIVYFELDRLEKAKEELTLSLNQFPSAKARFYLDRVRKALLEGETREAVPPKLTLAVEGQEIWTRDDPVILGGTAEDDLFVAAVSIGGIPLFLEASRKTVSFKEKLRLDQGRHVIQVNARNLLGKTTTKQLIFHVDREGPLVTIEDVKWEGRVAGKSVEISGYIHDGAGISALTVNGEDVGVEGKTEVFFQKKLDPKADEIRITTRDRLGNQTSAAVPARPASANRPPVRLACNDPVVAQTVLAGLFGDKDKTPPIISLKGWTDKQKVFLDKIYIEGQIRDESKIEGLTINQISTLRRKGKSIFFTHLARLEEGENRITISARDEADNEAVKTISVLREVPQALQLEERMSMTIMPFEHKAAVSENSALYQDLLINALVNENRFRVVERNQLDVILQEQKLSQTKLFEQKTALKLGKLVAAQSVLTGSLIETRSGVEIVARLIDTETSEILATQDVYDEAKDLQALKSLAEGMAVKFHREFPLLDGIIIQRKGKYIFTDLGKEKIKLQRKIIVYREEPIKHPVSGKILGADNIILARARVTQVLPEMSKAEILDQKPDEIKRLDRVITE